MMMKYVLLAFCLCFLAGFVASQNPPQYNLTTVVGLANATAGVNSYFTIQLVDASGKPTTYCPASNPFKITVTGKYPATGAIAVCDSGRYRASWSSTVAGAYNITISSTSTTPAVTLGPYRYFNLPGPIYPPTCNTTGNTAGGVAGQTFTFNIIARDQYGNLNTVCTPNIWSVVLSSGGTVVRGAVSSTCPVPGQYRVTYAPTVKGSYSMVVSANGYNIMGSPFTVNIAPGFFNPANSVVSPIGPIIEAGEELIFTVTSYDANKNPITICYPPQTVQWNNTLQLAGFSVAQINGYGNPNCTKGVYQFRFSETRASPNYFVSVTVNGTAVGSKSGLYPLSIQPSSVISAPFSLAAGVGLYNGVAGLPSLINITAFDQYDNVITDCEVTAPQNFEFSLTSLYASNLTCSGLGQACIEGDFSAGVPAVFQGTWYCDVATNYSLQISYQGENFNQTYYPAVRPGVLSGPFSTAYGPGTLEAYAGQESVIYVDPFDQYQNPIPTCEDIYFVGSNFSVQITNNSGASLQGRFNNCVQTGSGPNITLVYTLTSIYVTDLQVQYNGQNLYPGTFSLETYPGPPGAGKCHANGTGLSSATAGVKSYFSVWCTDAYDNLISQCLPYANWYANLTSEADGTVYTGNAFSCENTTSDRAYTFFEYTLYKSGQYDLDYGYLGNSNNDPHQVIVSPGPLDISNTIAQGYGVEGQDIPAGSNVSFTVYARDQYGNALQTCLNISDSKNPDEGLSFDFYPSNASYFSGPYVVPCDPASGNYNVTVYYTTTLAREYSVDVRYNDKAIHLSPYSPNWVAGPIDRSHIVAWGDEKAHSGLRFGIAGVTAFFFVNVSDQYNNRVEDCTAFQESDWTVTLNKINGTASVNGFVFACDNRTGIRQANYTATVSGLYSLDLQYQSGAVPGTYTPTIYPGPDDDSMALVWGPGVDESHNVVAGVSETIYVTPRDYYGNNLTHCSSPAITYTAILVPPPNTTANVSFTSGLCDPTTFTYSIAYVVYLADDWQVYVRGRQNLSNNHADMTVVPAPIYAPHTNASQPQGYTKLVAGQEVIVNLAVSDLYYNNISDCSYSNNSAWTIYAVPVNNKSMHYYASAVQCNNGILSATYSVRAYGTYNIYVTYYQGSARNSGYVSTFVAGTVSPGDSYAIGAGVNGTENVAGVVTSFTIYVANKYGIPITDGSLCSQFNLTDWTVQFDQTYSWNDSSATTAPVLSCNEVSGSFYGRYLPTRARVYSVDISLKGQSIAHVPYTPEVIPAAVYPPYTIVYGLNGTSGDNGTFFLQTQDRFHNNEIYTNKNNFNISLSPTCTETTITTRDAGNGTLEVDYSVTEGGVYCVSISYQGVFYPVLDSTIHAIGGTGCNSSCSTKGYCFKNFSPSTSDATYSCSCFQGWTGDDCSVKMSSRYPLAIGAVVGLIIGLGILMFIIGLILGFFVFRFLRRGEDHHALLD